jgi:2,3-bisphosphoglycerate-dependent phosphoglycerate mutase
VRLLLIRHGESSNNVLWEADRAAFVQARSDDPPLTERGHQQARLLAAWLRAGGEPIDRLAVSPMQRALETAAPIAEALGIVPEVHADVHEHGGMYVGDPVSGQGFAPTAGLGRSRIAELLPGATMPDALAEDGWWTGAHENHEARALRVARVAARLRDEVASSRLASTLAIVTHAGFAGALLGSICGSADAWFQHDNTGLTLLVLPPGQRVEVAYVNRTPHLD